MQSWRSDACWQLRNTTWVAKKLVFRDAIGMFHTTDSWQLFWINENVPIVNNLVLHLCFITAIAPKVSERNAKSFFSLSTCMPACLHACHTRGMLQGSHVRSQLQLVKTLMLMLTSFHSQNFASQKPENMCAHVAGMKAAIKPFFLPPPQHDMWRMWNGWAGGDKN